MDARLAHRQSPESDSRNQRYCNPRFWYPIAGHGTEPTRASRHLRSCAPPVDRQVARRVDTTRRLVAATWARTSTSRASDHTHIFFPAWCFVAATQWRSTQMVAKVSNGTPGSAARFIEPKPRRMSDPRDHQDRGVFRETSIRCASSTLRALDCRTGRRVGGCRHDRNRAKRAS